MRAPEHGNSTSQCKDVELFVEMYSSHISIQLFFIFYYPKISSCSEERNEKTLNENRSLTLHFKRTAFIQTYYITFIHSLKFYLIMGRLAKQYFFLHFILHSKKLKLLFHTSIVKFSLRFHIMSQLHASFQVVTSF